MTASTNEDPPSLPHSSPTQSYWHQVPLSATSSSVSGRDAQAGDAPPVLSSSPEAALPSEAEHVIVGSGVSGAMVGWGLLGGFNGDSTERGDWDELKKGPKVVMLEARDRAVDGATGRNGGHTKAASYRTFLTHLSRTPSPYEAIKILRFEHANIREVHAFAARHSIPCDSRPGTSVDILYDLNTFYEGKASITRLQTLLRPEERTEGGPGWYKLYTPEEAVAKLHVTRKNALGEEVVGAFEYQAGTISPYRFTVGVLKMCMERGMGLHTSTAVTDVQPIPIADESGGHYRWMVNTPRGSIKARNVILATNGYTAALLPELSEVIVPLRGQVTAQRLGSANRLPCPLPTSYSFIYSRQAGGYEYMIPRASSATEQDIVIGGGRGRLSDQGECEYGVTDDSALNPEISHSLAASAKGYFGDENWGERSDDEANKRVRAEWTGIMGTTRDEMPVVGEVPGKTGLWISAGFNGHGMIQSLRCAEALTHLVLGRKPEEMAWFPQSFLISEDRIKLHKKHRRGHRKGWHRATDALANGVAALSMGSLLS